MDTIERKPYASVNGAWPEGNLPVPTGPEAISAVRRLYRMAMKKPWSGKVKLTSGRRYTWPRRGTYFINPAGHHFGGWKDIVHDVSHYCHRRLHPTKRPHDFRHLLLEREMVTYVVSQGWLDGKLRRPETAKPKADPQQERYQRILARIKGWQSKEKRAATALKKLGRQRAYYEKVLT